MNYPDFQIDWLRAFVAVVDAGSLSGAAPLVHRSQSAVSRGTHGGSLRLRCGRFARRTARRSDNGVLACAARYFRRGRGGCARFMASW